MNLPDYNFLSAPLWLITVLHILTLTLHLIAMNFLVGGLIVVLFAKVKDKWNNDTVQKFIRMFPNAMAATITLGVAPLLFVQLVYHKQLYSASIISGWYWIWIIGALIFSYYFLYGASFGLKKSGFNPQKYLWPALLGVLYIGFVYSAIFSLGEHPDIYKSLYAANQSGTAFNPEFGSYFFRWLHTMLGAVTVGGFFVGLLGRKDETIFKIGKTFYLWGMVAAIVVGVVYMMTFGDYLVPYMRSLGIWMVLVTFILSAASLHFFFKKKMLIAGLMLFVSILAMVINRHVVRLMFLGDNINPEAMPVNPQWSIFILFLICFVVMLGLVYYMLRLFFTSKETAS